MIKNEKQYKVSKKLLNEVVEKINKCNHRTKPNHTNTNFY